MEFRKELTPITNSGTRSEKKKIGSLSLSYTLKFIKEKKKKRKRRKSSFWAWLHQVLPPPYCPQQKADSQTLHNVFLPPFILSLRVWSANVTNQRSSKTIPRENWGYFFSIDLFLTSGADKAPHSFQLNMHLLVSSWSYFIICIIYQFIAFYFETSSPLKEFYYKFNHKSNEYHEEDKICILFLQNKEYYFWVWNNGLVLKTMHSSRGPDCSEHSCQAGDNHLAPGVSTDSSHMHANTHT